MSEVQSPRGPVRSVNAQFLQGLSVVSNRVYPLPGGVCQKVVTDSRLTHLASLTDLPDTICLFEHVATVFHKDTNQFFVVFRKTMDALLHEQQDSKLYPQWLMDSAVKATELSVFIHFVKDPFNKNPSTVTRDRSIMDTTRQTRLDKWLEPITITWVFDTLAYYLLHNKIISEEMYGKI